MNSYNENLQSIVSGTLQNQDKDQKDLKAQFNASLFTLYYAEGATITATEKLAAAHDDLDVKTAINKQAVTNSNISNNLLSTATQANQYLTQSVSNIAICAANVQAANNAILRLSTDVGGILSIVRAADLDEDFCNLTEQVSTQVSKTASDAEIASRIALDASRDTAEVSSSTVLGNAKNTGTLMGNLMSIVSSDFNSASQVVAADNATLALASTTEKLADGSLRSTLVDYEAAKSAYASINKELNLNLQVTNPFAWSFTVSFDWIKSPFEVPTGGGLYPVSDYYIVVVKESKKSIFNISDAENLLLNGKKQYEQVTGQVDPGTQKQGPIIEVQPTKTVEIKSVKGVFPFTDSDNQPIKPGANYVVFVLAVYRNDYKRAINDIDDFLSAPSQVFCLTEPLDAVDSSTIKITPLTTATKSKEEIKNEEDFQAELNRILKNDVRMEWNTGSGNTPSSEIKYSITFNAKANNNTPADPKDTPKSKVAYRCMLLPYTNASNDSKIATLKTDLANEELELLHAINTKNVDAVVKLTKSCEALLESLITLTNERYKSQGGPGFEFDTMIAAQVKAGNYIPAVPNTDPKAKNGWVAFIKPGATDNFGNLLINKDAYIPVIFSVPADGEDADQYTTALSGTADVNLLVYSDNTH